MLLHLPRARLKVYSVESGVRVLAAVSRDSPMSCSDTHTLSCSSKGVSYCAIRDKPTLLTALSGFVYNGLKDQ